MLQDIKKVSRSLGFAFHGLCHAYKSDKSFRMEFYYGLPVYLVLGWHLLPFEPWELIVFIFSYILILIIELVNTAFETTLDHLHPHQHEKVKMAKDIAAGAVLLSLLFAAAVIGVLLYTRMTAELPSFSITQTFV